MIDPGRYGRVTDEVLASLTEIVGAQHVLTGDELENYSRDETPKLTPMLPEVVVRPENTASVARIMKLANDKLIPVTPMREAPASPVEHFPSTAALYSLQRG